MNPAQCVDLANRSIIGNIDSETLKRNFIFILKKKKKKRNVNFK